MTDVTVSAEAVAEVQPSGLAPDVLDDRLISHLVDRTKAGGIKASAAASSRCTSAPWSPWCTCASTTGLAGHQVERGMAQLKSWRTFQKSRMSPNRMTSVAKAVLTLERQR